MAQEANSHPWAFTALPIPEAFVNVRGLSILMMTEGDTPPYRAVVSNHGWKLSFNT